MTQNGDELDGCELDFTEAQPTTENMLESLLIPKGEEVDEDDD